MKKLLIFVLAIIILPAVILAGLNFGLIKAAKKTVDKVDEKVVIKKAELPAIGNRAPVISSLVANPTTVSTGAVSAITCSASDADGDTLTYSWSAASGTISGTGSTINWTAPASSSTYAINVTVSDGHGGSAQTSVNVPVTKSNNSPVISSIVANPATVSTGAVSAINCTASDADGDILTYTWSAASGTISGTGATVNWTAPASSSTYIINVTVSDGHGGSAQTSVNISVTKSNNSPVIAAVVANPTTISTGAVSAITCTASDADSDTLTYTWSAASGTITGTGATVNWTAPASSSTYVINVTVSDGHGGSTQSSVNIVTTRGNFSPVISSVVPNPATLSTGAVSAITCSASDADNDTLTYAWSAASGTISGTGSTINWTTPSSSSTYIINVTVSDGHGGSVQASTSVVVTKLNNPPTISSVVANPTVISTGAVSVITCSATDADNDILTYTWTAASGTISGTGSTINWTAPTTWIGNASSATYIVNVAVSDNQGGLVQASTNIVAVVTDTGTWTTYTTANGLGADITWTTVIDGSGNKWFGTSGGGASKYTGSSWTSYNMGNSGIASNVVESIAIDGLGTKWFASNPYGVSKYDGTTWTTYNMGNSGLASNYVHSVVIDGAGYKWFGTEVGVSKFTGAAWTTYNTGNSGLAHNYVIKIAIDGSGNYWFATYGGGVSRFTGAAWTTYNTGNSGLASDLLQAITIDALGNKWFGTSTAGVSKFNGTSWTTYNTGNSGLINNAVTSIAMDGLGNYWFTTYGGGVSKFDGTNWTTYNTGNSGLALDDVLSVTIDAAGTKWFGTHHGGVSKYTGK